MRTRWIVVLIVLNLGLIVHAVRAVPQPTVVAQSIDSEEIGDCLAVGQAEKMVLYRCTDPDYGKVCYFFPMAAVVPSCVDE